jgi:glycosyltransferase involved in cell wall biosynthesis
LGGAGKNLFITSRKSDIKLVKRVLVISPHFPPVNAPDMQRIRMALPYFEGFDWEPVIISVDEKYVNGFTDENLLDTIPGNIEIHRTKAFDNGLTKLAGIGNISLKSCYHIYRKGCELLSSQKFDLIFFTTSNFYVCTLGPIWKNKFKVPFVVDFQDPWYNNALNGKNSFNFPGKANLSQALHKKLEAYTIPKSDGIISVSQGYIRDIKNRYDGYSKPSQVINFGSSAHDFEVVANKKINSFPLEKGKINVVYPGALTSGFLPVIKAFFRAFNESNIKKDLYMFYFVGTSYFKTEKGILADFISENKLTDLIKEYPDRLTYFETLATMKAADILLLPGSLDGDYNPSKICNAIMSGTPVFSIFNKNSIVHTLVNNTNAGISIEFENTDTEEDIYIKISNQINKFHNLHKKERNSLKTEKIADYSAKQLTKRLCEFFNEVIEIND